MPIFFSYIARHRFLEKSSLDTKRLCTLSFSSECGEATCTMSPMASFVRRRYNVTSDGAVAVADAKFPGADFIHVVGMDHGGTVFPGITGEDPTGGETMQALITMVLAMPRAEASSTC